MEYINQTTKIIDGYEVISRTVQLPEDKKNEFLLKLRNALLNATTDKTA